MEKYLFPIERHLMYEKEYVDNDDYYTANISYECCICKSYNVPSIVNSGQSHKHPLKPTTKKKSGKPKYAQ